MTNTDGISFIALTMNYISTLELLPVDVQGVLLEGLQNYIKDRRVELQELKAKQASGADNNDA